MYWLNWDISSLERFCFQPLSCPHSCGPHQLTSGWHVVLKSRRWIWGKGIRRWDLSTILCAREKRQRKQWMKRPHGVPTKAEWVPEQAPATRTDVWVRGDGPTQPHVSVSRNLQPPWLCQHSGAEGIHLLPQRRGCCRALRLSADVLSFLTFHYSFPSFLPLCYSALSISLQWRVFPSALLEREHLTLVSYQCNLHLIVSLLNETFKSLPGLLCFSSTRLHKEKKSLLTS